MGGSNTATQTGTQSGTTSYNPNPAIMAEYGNVIGTGMGLANSLINNPPTYPGQAVAAPGQLTQQYWNQAAQGVQAPDISGLQGAYADIYNRIPQTMGDPNAINLPQFNQQSFQPGALNLPQFGNVPNVSAPGGVSGLASYYQVNPQQVSAQNVNASMVNAPAAIDPITGMPQVSAPQLQQYQMAGVKDVSAQNLQNFQMQAAANVAPSAQIGTQSFTQPGTAAQYMSPYTQQVVDVQTQKAIQDWQQANETQRSQAAAAGAYGGTRQAVEEATGQRDLQLQLAQIQATGLQNAYQQAQQQFNQEQAARQQAGQFNVSTSLQAALANQQAQQQANVQNLSSYLQTQGLSAQTGLQAALANQQAGLQVGSQNLSALLQTQQLGAQTGMQAQLANQQSALQTALANQQAQEFGAGQQLQSSLANQQAGLTAQQLNQQANLQAGLANQQAGVQTGLAAQQLGFQGAQFNAQQGLQAQLANQAAMMQALGMQYQGGLQGALQTQQLGLQGAEMGGQLGLSAAQQQQAARLAQSQFNLQGLQQQAGQVTNLGQLYTQNMQNAIQAMQAQAAPAMSQQGYLQQVADQAYQQWLQQNQAPFQATAYEAGLLGMQPLPYTTTSTTTGNQQLTTPGPNIVSQIIGGVLGIGGLLGGLKKGGRVPSGLGTLPPAKRFQYGGFEGLTPPHYPQPIFPSLSMPDLLSRYTPPKQETPLEVLAGYATPRTGKDRKKGAIGKWLEQTAPVKWLGSIFHKKPTDTTGTTDTSSQATTTTGTYPEPQGGATPPSEIPPPSSAGGIEARKTTEAPISDLDQVYAPEAQIGNVPSDRPPEIQSATPYSLPNPPTSGGGSSLMMGVDRYGNNIHSIDGGMNWINDQTGSKVSTDLLSGGTAYQSANIGGYRSGGLAHFQSGGASGSWGTPPSDPFELSPEERQLEWNRTMGKSTPYVTSDITYPRTTDPKQKPTPILPGPSPMRTNIPNPEDIDPVSNYLGFNEDYKKFLNRSASPAAGAVWAPPIPTSPAEAAGLAVSTGLTHLMPEGGFWETVGELADPAEEAGKALYKSLFKRGQPQNPSEVQTVRARGGPLRFQSGGDAEDTSSLASAAKPAAGNPYLKPAGATPDMRSVSKGLASSGLLDRLGLAFSPSLYPWMPSVWSRAGLAEGGRVHEDAAADRRQVLNILREKKLIKKQSGGLSSAVPGSYDILPMRPGQQGPAVHQVPPQQMDQALGKAATVTRQAAQAAAPMGLAAWGSLPMEMLGPALMRSVLGPFTPQRPGLQATPVEPPFVTVKKHGGLASALPRLTTTVPPKRGPTPYGVGRIRSGA